MTETSLSRNGLAFIALANEYCHDIEHAIELEKNDFISRILKLLPRIYIAATDIIEGDDNYEGGYYIDSYLDEDVYDTVKNNMCRLLGESDVYLEVFEEDMKYSDTPIANSISENLADVYQDLYNFVAAVKDVPNEVINELLVAVKESFASYWGQKMANVMRALHNIKYNDVQDFY